MKRHLVRCAVAIAAILTVATVVGPPLSPQPVLDAQYEENYCRIDRRVENRLRKVRGNVNVECGGDVDPNECFEVGGITICHSAPFGNWGTDSPWGGTADRKLFAGAAPAQVDFNSGAAYRFTPRIDVVGRPVWAGWSHREHLRANLRRRPACGAAGRTGRRC